MKEIWVPLHGFERRYHISNLGRIKRLNYHRTGKEKILKIYAESFGYSIIGINKNNFIKLKKVHCLVLETFVGPRPKGMEFCHNDGNPSNNRLENLRWDTPKNNQLDKIKHGTHMDGEKHWKSKIDEKDVLNIHKLKKKGLNSIQISKMFSLTHSNIRYILKGKTWKNIYNKLNKGKLL